MAISALNKDGGLELEEIQLSLARAVKSSPKSSVIAHYPKENYDIADLRLDIVANLASIRRNPDAPRAIKFVIDVKMEDGSYFLENKIIRIYFDSYIFSVDLVYSLENKWEKSYLEILEQPIITQEALNNYKF